MCPPSVTVRVCVATPCGGREIPQVSNTPLLAASVSLVVALITSLTTFFVQERRLRRESDLQLRLQEEKLRNELKIASSGRQIQN